MLIPKSEIPHQIGWKIRKLWHFDSLYKSSKHFLMQLCMNAKWASWWCHDLTIWHLSFAQKWLKSCHICTYENSWLASIWIDVEYVNSNTAWYEGHTIAIISPKYWIFPIWCHRNIWQVVRRWHHELAHLHIHIGQEMFCENLRNFKVYITSEFFRPNLIKFSIIVHKILHLLKCKSKAAQWSSPLKTSIALFSHNFDVRWCFYK